MACADESDPAHRKAVATRDAWLEGGGFFVTSDYVTDETLTLIRIRLGIRAAEAWWRQVDGSSRVRWEQVTLARADKARGLFFRYRDKGFSFTDCTSFILMRELKLREALTTDHHFIQAGFGIKP
jgi:predicted nucleic acid-binding protein